MKTPSCPAYRNRSSFDIAHPRGWTALRMAAAFMQSPGGGDDNKLTRAKVGRKRWVGAEISHRTTRVLGARGLLHSNGFGRNGTRLA
jgi:hypothetical protein